MSIGDQIDARLAMRWTQGLIMFLLFVLIGGIAYSIDSREGYLWMIVLGMIVAWLLGAAYGRRRVYRDIGRSRE